ncbi:MAG: type VI secretion system lipoprotein TssJ [Gammaproteobacteria bacterium]|nr:type VI secretion system lipoprotein TssJ [Gammaproteobacteria bacterium]
MHRLILLIAILTVNTLFAGCSMMPSMPEVPFLKDGIGINVKAEKDLNTFNREPHTLVVVVYQFSEQGTFRTMLEDPAGVATLLEGGTFDKTVMARNKLVVQPGEKKRVYIDRIAGVRYLGVVAGYYVQQPGSIGRMIPFERQSKLIYFWRWFQTDPSETRLELMLGRDGIVGNLL